MSVRSFRRRLRRRLRTWRASPAVRRTGIVAGLLLGFGLLWIVVTGFLVRQQLADISLRLQQVRYLVSEGKVAEARQLAQDIPAMADRAHRLTTGPAWWVAAHVPYLGEPLDVMRDVTAVSDDIGTRAVPKLVTVIATLDPQKLRTNGATIRTGPLIAIRPQLHAAARILDAAGRRFGTIERHTWFGAVDSKRNQIDQQVQLIRGYVDAAARTSDVLPEMLGADGPRRYFVGLQTEAELRGTGGLPGAFTIVSATKGTLRFERFESDTVLLPKKDHNLVPTGLDFGRDYANAYGASQPTSSYVDSNVSPHFPYAAQIWAAMWQKVSGQRVDGVLAIDPTVLSYLLAVTGPVPVPGAGVVTGSNVVQVTQRDEYAIFHDNTSRKNFNVALLKAVAHRLTSGAGRPVGLLRAVSYAASERRFLVWSRDPAVEKVLGQTTYAGAIPATAAPFSALILNNAAAGKLDYYLQRSLTYSSTGCGQARTVTVTIELTNSAPASGLPSYVTDRLDRGRPKNAKPGDNRTLLDYYATRGALLRGVTLNGRTSTIAQEMAFGHPVFRMDLELPRGQTQTLVLHLQEPTSTAPVQLWSQPGVTPLDSSVYQESC